MIRINDRGDDMTKQDAIQELNDQFMQGDIDADDYELERKAIEYAAGEAANDQDEQREVAL